MLTPPENLQLRKVVFRADCLFSNLPNDLVTLPNCRLLDWPPLKGPTGNAHHLCSAGLTGRGTDDANDCRTVWPSSHLMQAVELIKL